MTCDVLCIGAGPAGLTASYLLTKKRVPTIVAEADPERVGGISRTVTYKGFGFDIGGHRFFSKSREVEELWDELLPGDMLERPRSSRIYYRGKFFAYPLRALDALAKLGPFEAARCLASYLYARAFPIENARNFEDWVTNQFGWRLYSIFFRTYTEKVWGMPCREISADWAAQRIKGLSLATAIRHALLPRQRAAAGDREGVVKTLIDTFRYPRRGPGMMWEAAARRTRAQGGLVLLGHAVTGLERGGGERPWTVTLRRTDGSEVTVSCRHVISSAPLRDVVAMLRPVPRSTAAAAGLKYRDFLTVALIVRERGLFDDNWIYIHEPKVRVGRIQNYKSWSPEMVPDENLCCYGMEYFCFEGDGLWASPDEKLIELAARELTQLGLVRGEDVLDGCVVRQKKAYPVYEETYAARVEAIRREFDADYPGLHLVGRNGMHKYNNQDHAMMTAMLTVENIVAGRRVFDPWCVNEDAEYHESGWAGERRTIVPRLVPRKVAAPPAEPVLEEPREGPRRAAR